MAGLITVERKRSFSLPNLLEAFESSGEAEADRDWGRVGSPGLDPTDEVMVIPYHTLLEASRSMERLQQELENRENVIRELVCLRAKDKEDFEQQLCQMQGQLLQERAKARSMMAKCVEDMKLQRVNSGIGGIGGARAVTQGVTVLNDSAWNNKATQGNKVDVDVLVDTDDLYLQSLLD
jgi:hypothetical protein